MIKFAQKINNTFVSVSQDLDPLEPLSYTQYDNLPDELIITVDSVEKQLLYTKLHKAIEPDQMPNWILKDAAAIIAAPICHLFHSSLRNSYIPALWKSANVCHLPKTKPIQNLSKDLRPISFTPVLTKMLEHYLIQHMRNTCQVVDPNQFGVVKGSSTTFALLEIFQPIYQATDDYRNYARVLLIDFRKAFDHTDHQILLQKLDKNGVHRIVQQWCHSFL